jgi:hypothetical protein
MTFPRDLVKAEARLNWSPENIQSLRIEEVVRQEKAGATVGAVVTSLWALICEDSKRATLNRAIQAAENVGVEHDHQTGRSSFFSHLREFDSVLHLLGAWDLRGRRFKKDPAIGYSEDIDARFFVAEAQVLLRKLREWSDARRAADSLLASEKFEGGPEWMPPDPAPDTWPKTGRIFWSRLTSDNIVGHRPVGRPRKLRQRQTRRWKD